MNGGNVMNNIIILKHGHKRLSKNEIKKFNKGDSIFGNKSNPEEIKRWSMDCEDDAIETLKEFQCIYKDGDEWDIDEYVLDYVESGEHEFAKTEIYINDTSCFGEDCYCQVYIEEFNAIEEIVLNVYSSNPHYDLYTTIDWDLSDDEIEEIAEHADDIEWLISNAADSLIWKDEDFDYIRSQRIENYIKGL